MSYKKLKNPRNPGPPRGVTIDAPATRCNSCGVEVAVSVLEKHKTTVQCQTRSLAIWAEADGMVRCSEAFFDHLLAAGVRAKRLLTRVNLHDGRKISKDKPYEEPWADKVAVEIMRQHEWRPEMRIKAIEVYAEWRKNNPYEQVHVSGNVLTCRTDGWDTNGMVIGESSGVRFTRHSVSYDGILRTIDAKHGREQ